MEGIRDERRTYANTATRIGEALIALLGAMDEGTISDDEFRRLLLRLGREIFLSKQSDDTAEGKITFKKGLTALGDAEFGEFVEGLYAGKGGRIDVRGNAEVESLRVRTALEVLELIVNRLSAIEGDQVLTESDTVESIEELTDADSSGNAVYRLHLKDKWDGYLTAQYENNVLKGIFNSLPAKAGGISDISASESRESDGGNAYFTSWMRILPDGVHAASGHNWIDVVLYGDSSTPAGKNYPPCPMMRLARWGNCGDTEVYDNDDADTRARKAQYKRRQSCLYLSSTDGRIVKLKDVNKPIMESWMYGFTLGIVPDFLLQDPKLSMLIDPERDYAFFDGIITRDILRYDKQGKPLVTHVAYTEWEDEHRYYFETVNEATGVYETSDVYHNGCKWSCLVNQPRMVDGVAVYDEPGWNSPSWLMIEGNAELSMRFYTVDGVPYGDTISVRPSQVNIPLIPHVFFGYEDITDRLGVGSDVWTWARSIVPGAWTERTYIDSETGEPTTSSTRSVRLTNNDMPGGWGLTGVNFTCTALVSGIPVSKSANIG